MAPESRKKSPIDWGSALGGMGLGAWCADVLSRRYPQFQLIWLVIGFFLVAIVFKVSSRIAESDSAPH